ncbi:MAG: hypothetical protein BHW66_08325 [Akkermansia sp. 54_46]|nr:MAG: hypothetical protein BHW66_08325 [Akkermansia sp. 54_46]
MTNWGWFTTITVIIIPKMAGGLVEILPKKKKLTIYIGLSEIIHLIHLTYWEDNVQICHGYNQLLWTHI